MLRRLVPIGCGVATIGLLLAFMHRDYPQVGLDFGYFVPRFIDTDLHIRANGLAPQWYTPSFGSGLPAFANPQHSQYSITQLLYLVMGPWQAILASTALVSAVGFAAFYLFLRGVLNLSMVASTIGAIGLIGNGFYIEKTSSGQFSFALFPLVGVFLLAATSRRISPVAGSAMCGLAAAAIIHSGGGLLAVLLAATLIMTLQVVHLLDPRSMQWGRVMTIGAISGVIAIALCASKLYAVSAFMSQFPRTLADAYPIGVVQGLFGLGSQLAGGMMIVPVLVAGGFPPQRLDDALVRVTGSGVHVAEIDASVQPVLSIVLAVAVARLLWLALRGGGLKLSRPQAIEILLLAVTVWIAVETTLAKGFIYPALHQLPFFRSMHVNHRVASVFIVPITVAGAWALNAWAPHRRALVGGFLLVVALAFQSSYFFLPELFYRRWFDITQNVKDHDQVRRGERFAVTNIGDILEDRVFVDRATSRAPYEPLFGYNNEYFKAETVFGPIDTARDGHFNLTNPASLVFPELNGLRPFERIRADDRENLRRFVNREQPDWKHPAILDWLNALAVVTFLGCVAILARSALRRT